MANIVVVATAGAAPAVQLYQPSAEDFPNPERGFYHYTESHFRADGSGYTALSEAVLRRWRASDGTTLVYRIYYLEKYVGRSTIDAADLKRISADFATARSAGVKLVLRFAYSDTSGRDAASARAIAHIRALSPVLKAGADVISVLQAGFVGRWGEWYESDSYSSDRARPWALSRSDTAARRAVLNAVLDATTPGTYVQVRYPSIKRTLMAAGDPRAARVGIHDDCFLASADDLGTYSASDDRTWLAEQTRSVPMGGETCQVNPPRSQWPTARTELADYHWSFLNADYHPGVLNSWGSGGLAEARQRLGYRLRLVSASIPDSAPAGGSMSVTLSIANDGFASLFRARPVRLVLRGAAGTFTVAVPVDVRTLAPGHLTTVSAKVSAPAKPGTYALALALPDPAPSLAAQPAFAIRLANAGMWDPATGRNDLKKNIRVDPPKTIGR